MNLKKIFTMGVVMTTIVWSLGVATLVPSVVSAADASCPTLVAGDLIKVSGKPAIYALDNNLNYRYFPDGDVFKSWNADESYSKYYKTISQACFDSLAQPAQAPYHVFYRAGSYLVKYLSSDTLYVVSLNNKLIPITDAAAKAIFGTNYTWKTIGLSEWPLYTKDTTTITEATVYPGMLVKADGKTYFVDEGKVLREVTAEGMTANRFKTAFVRTVSITGLTTGATISSEIPSFTKRVGDSSTPGTPVATGKLTVALAMDTPAANSVPQNGTRVPFTKVNLTAGTDNAINVDAIVVKRTGLSSYDYFDGTAGSVWVEKNGVRVSSQADMNSSDEVNLTFSPVLNIPAGQTVTLEIVASLDNAAGNGALGISAASAVSAGGVTVAGSFPIFGNLMSFTTYNVASADVDFSTTPKSPKVGDTYAELAGFIVTATTTKDVVFKSIMLKNAGNEDMATALSNVYLEKAGTIVSSAGVINGRYITFTLNDGGLLIEKGDNPTFKVKGDIMAKENTSAPSFRFSVNKTEDVSIIEKSTGFGAAVTKDSDYNDVTITSGALSITKKSTTPSDTDAIKGTDGYVSLIANVRADEAIRADGINIGWEGSDVTTSFENAKVYVNGYLLGSFDPTIDNTNSTTDKEIESAVTFNKGDNEIKITIDAKSNAESADYIKFKIVGADFVSGLAPEYVVSGNAVADADVNGSPTGAKITIQGAGLTVSRNDGYAEMRKTVQGTNDVVLGKFNVKAVNAAVTITSISANANNAGGTQVAHSSVFDAKIFVDGVQVGNTRDFNNDGASGFGIPNIVINKDQVKVIEIKASFDTASTGTIRTALVFSAQDSNGKTITGISNGTTVTHDIVGAGTLSIAKGSATRDASIILANATEQEVATFKLTSLNDLSNITEMTLVNSSTDVIDSRVSKVKLYKGFGSNIGTTPIAEDFFMNNSTTLKINTDALIVGANQEVFVTVKVLLNTIEEASQSSSTLQAKVTGMKFKGSAGTEQISSDTVAGNVMQIRKTLPKFTKVALSTTGLGSSDEEVLKFTITADANGGVLINTLTFVEEGMATTSVGSFEIFEGDTSKGTSTDGTFTFSTPLTIDAGNILTYTVKANTSGIDPDPDQTYGLKLEKGTTNGNILWAENFAGDDNPGDAQYLWTLPISNVKTY